MFYLVAVQAKANSATSFEDFSILTHETKRGLLELSKSLFIIRNNPSLNRNIKSASLHLFDKL